MTIAWILIGIFLSIMVMQERSGGRKSSKLEVEERSNVIQYDRMGYPLRLCIMTDGTQMWLDTEEREGDVVLKWKT